MTGRHEALAWTVIVPLKPFGASKSRIDLPGTERERLARVMAAHALATIAGTPDVESLVVVSPEPDDVASIVPAGARLLREPAGSGLNGALRFALEDVARARGAGLGPHAIIVGDLPFLTVDDLSEAFGQAASVAFGVVADRHGSGTTMITSRADVPLTPRFGLHSFGLHRDSGYAPLPLREGSTLRLDVDTLEDWTGSETVES